EGRKGGWSGRWERSVGSHCPDLVTAWCCGLLRRVPLEASAGAVALVCVVRARVERGGELVAVLVARWVAAESCCRAEPGERARVLDRVTSVTGGRRRATPEAAVLHDQVDLARQRGRNRVVVGQVGTRQRERAGQRAG